MNAEAGKIRPAARDRYRMIVQHHCPAASEEETQLRCSILLVRDKAASAMRGCSDEARGILTEIQSLAAIHGFRLMSLTQLAELRRHMVRLLSCASGLEMFAYELGGADARG